MYTTMTRRWLSCFSIALILYCWSSSSYYVDSSRVVVAGDDDDNNNNDASSSSSSSSSSHYACSKFKAPHADTPPYLRRTWQQDDEALWSYVEQHVPAVLDHTGSSAFDEHLKGVQAVLRYWRAPAYLTRAGLFHSIYGTEGFQGFSLPLSERAVIRDLIGIKAEQLCFWFCMVDRLTLDETVMKWNNETENLKKQQGIFRLRSRPELGRFDILLKKDEWLDFIELTLADWLEQVEGSATKPSDLFLWKNPGEAYAYRRLAYRKMSEVLAAERPERLSTVPKEMLHQVMATEDVSTRHLVQVRTPPMSEAAKLALEALRANGEVIPTDLFTPQPYDETLLLLQHESSSSSNVHDAEL